MAGDELISITLPLRLRRRATRLVVLSLRRIAGDRALVMTGAEHAPPALQSSLGARRTPDAR
jgi:hypothetical protein